MQLIVGFSNDSRVESHSKPIGRRNIFISFLRSDD